MKRIILSVAAIIAMATTFASQNRKVLIIGIDGVRADALQQADVPNIDALIASGFSTFEAWHLGITVSGPSWSTIFNGVWHQKHGVTDNSFAGSHYDTYPFYPKRAKELLPNLNAVQVNDWAPLSTQVTNDGYNQKIVRLADYASMTSAVKIQLQNPNVDVIDTHWDMPDGAGHGSGFSPSNPIYMQTIHAVDSCIGKVMEALQARPNYASENWLVLLITDHGGTGTSHGGNSDAERKIWWIGSGKNVIQREITGVQDPGSYVMSGNPVNPALVKKAPVQADIAVTALHHLLYETLDSAQFAAKIIEWNLDGKSWLDSIKTEGVVPPDTTTGIANRGKDEIGIKLFPNPATGLVSLWMETELSAVVSYAVINVQGRVVLDEKHAKMASRNKLNIDMSTLPAGNYFIRVTTGNKQAVKQVVLIP